MPHFRITFFAAALSTVVVATTSISSFAQAAAPLAAVVRAQPAPLDPVALEKKIDELIHAHMKVNDFSGTLLLARDGKPLVAGE